MKLQQAYFSESNKAGGWQLIGYMAPGNNSETTNFNYHPGSAIAVGGSADLSTTAVVGWQAANKVNLNECAGDGSTYHWQVSMTAGTTTTNGQADVVFAATASANNGTGCVALTPTFDKIGK